MRIAPVGAAVLMHLTTAAATLTAVHSLGTGDPRLAPLLGTIVGSQAGAVDHLQRGSVDSARARAVFGLAMSVTTVLFVWIAHWLTFEFTSLGVILPAAALGSFFITFALFDTLWTGLSQAKKQ